MNRCLPLPKLEEILDGPFILDELIQWCKRKKNQLLVFKVDFEKAFDSVRWDFLDDILKKFGFGEKWCKWIQSCLRSSRGSIILNGSPTEEFQFHKGLKQGDPLSPFLFILVMESLHISFQRVEDAGLFNGIKLDNSVSISHLFYADDAVFVGQWCENNINTLVYVLECFFRASGLRINMSKSKLMGLHVDSDKIKAASSKLGCLTFKPPFTYLGSTVGGSMSRIKTWDDVVDRVSSRLSKWKMKMLSIGGRLTLLKSVLGSTPIFHMSIHKVPLGVLRKLEAIRSHFFNGCAPNCNKASWVNWKNALASKKKGGLGIASLYALNRGLMFKWYWRFQTQGSSLWSRVIKALHGETGNVNASSGLKTSWTNIVKEVNFLASKGIDLRTPICFKLGNGEKARFWEDIWFDGVPHKTRFPHVYALESCKDITVASKTSHLNFASSLYGPGTFLALVRFVPIKVNVIAWKVKNNSLPTRFNISRRGISINCIKCAICDIGVETVNHLFFSCELVTQLVKMIVRWRSVPYLEIDSYAEWVSWMDNLHLPIKNKLMLEGVFYVMWCDDEIQALIQKQIEEDMVHQKAILDLALQFDNACATKEDHILQESCALIDTFLKEGGSSSQTHEICDVYLTAEELHQLHLDEEALREILEEQTMDEKAREKIRQKQADDDEYFMEFGVMRIDSDYESSD
ncbi:RNA-directed DNA polymerase, eukaryota [Tanacetum coccineum]